MKLAGIIDGGVTMREVLRIIAGNICITGAYAFITVPCHIVNGGITSFSMILHNFINMDISFFTNAITILLLILCFFQLGKSFLLKSLLGAVTTKKSHNAKEMY